MKLNEPPERGLEVASRPSRGAWIETFLHNCVRGDVAVAPFTGRVD